MIGETLLALTAIGGMGLILQRRSWTPHDRWRAARMAEGITGEALEELIEMHLALARLQRNASAEVLARAQDADAIIAKHIAAEAAVLSDGIGRDIAKRFVAALSTSAWEKCLTPEALAAARATDPGFAYAEAVLRRDLPLSHAHEAEFQAAFIER
jgi:hypothetical protein